MIKKKIKTGTLLLLLLMMLAACFPVFSVETEAAVKISHTNVFVPIGMKKKLSIAGTKKKAIWKSTNKAVATVSSSGMVKGIKSGSTTITAKVSGKTLKCKIQVINKYNAKQVGNAVVKKSSEVV